MERKKAVAEEHRYRRGQLIGATKASDCGASSVKSTTIEVAEKYPWEVREEVSQAELRNLIARKPHHQNRKDILIGSQNGD